MERKKIKNMTKREMKRYCRHRESCLNCPLDAGWGLCLQDIKTDLEREVKVPAPDEEGDIWGE
jgi:hypothetical protein